MSATTAAPLRYRGSSNFYVDIATRNAEHLGFSLEYAIHPSNIGCFIVRFVVHGDDINPKNYKHLTYREKAKFIIPATAEKPMVEMFKGYRLNKIALPVFKPAVQRYEVGDFATKFNIWPLLIEWVAEQVQAEGFTLTVDLEAEMRGMLAVPTTPEVTVTSVIEFPDLKGHAQQAAALKLVKAPEPDEDDEDDASEDDEDEDGDDKGWLN